MKTITSTHLAAAKRAIADPLAYAIIEDRRLRWTEQHTFAVDDPLIAAFNNGSITVRTMAYGGAGQILMARVWDHSDPDEWDSWTAITGISDAVPYVDTALAWQAPYTWFLFYQRATNKTSYRISTDNGLTFGAASDIRTSAVTPRIAAWGGTTPSLVIQDNDIHLYHWTGSTWAGPYSLGQTLTNIAGIACYHNGDAATTHIIYAARGVIRQVVFDHDTNTYGAITTIAPSRDNPSSALTSFAHPSLTYIPDIGLVASWREDYTGALSTWHRPVITISRDLIHWGATCPIAEPDVSNSRWTLSYQPQDKILNAAPRTAVYQAPAFDKDIREWMRAGPLPVLRYELESYTHTAGRLSATVLDADMDYRGPGVAGATAEALKPLATLRIARGYLTSAGEELIETNGYHITSAHLSEQGVHMGHLHLVATDAWGLLDMWSPPESYEYYNRTIGHTLHSIIADAGLMAYVYEWNEALQTPLPYFALHPHQTAAQAVRALLAIAGCTARPRGNHELAIYGTPPTLSPRPTVNQSGEVRASAWGIRLQPYTSARTTSMTHMVYAAADDLDATRYLGQRFARTVTDNRIHTADLAQSHADHAIALAAMQGRSDVITVPLRPDLEVLDTVDVYAPTAAIPATDRARVITYLHEEHEPRDNRHHTTLHLGRYRS